MNKCHFHGNLTRDPEVITLKSGDKVVKFGLAVNNRKDNVVFLDCEAWGKPGELIEKHFQKGNAIIVHCHLREDSWTSSDGQKRKKLKFVVEGLDFLNTKKSDTKSDTVLDVEAPVEQVTEQVTEQVATATEEIPF